MFADEYCQYSSAACLLITNVHMIGFNNSKATDLGVAALFWLTLWNGDQFFKYF